MPFPLAPSGGASLETVIFHNPIANKKEEATPLMLFPFPYLKVHFWKNNNSLSGGASPVAVIFHTYCKQEFAYGHNYVLPSLHQILLNLHMMNKSHHCLDSLNKKMSSWVVSNSRSCSNQPRHLLVNSLSSGSMLKVIHHQEKRHCVKSAQNC